MSAIQVRPLPTPPAHDPRPLLQRRSPKANSFQKQQERDQRQLDNPNDPRDPHDPAEAETELRDYKAGEAVGRALSDFCRNQSLTGEDLKRKLMKTLCDQ